MKTDTTQTPVYGRCDNCGRCGVLLVRMVRGRSIRFECLIRRDCTDAALHRREEAA